MVWHARFGRGHHQRNRHRADNGGYGAFARPPDYPQRRAALLGRPKPMLWVLVLAGAGLWSLMAWVAYGLAEPFFGWAAINAGPFATGLGISEIGRLLGQLSAWLQAIVKPVILIVWAVGVLGLLAAPTILPALFRLRGRYHH